MIVNLSAYTDSAAMANCQKQEESYGEICVGCGQCGREFSSSPLPLSEEALADVRALLELSEDEGEMK